MMTMRMRLTLDPGEARSCCPQASSGIATYPPCSHKSESMSLHAVIRQLSESGAAHPAVRPCTGASGRCGSAHDAGGRVRVDGDKVRSPAHWFCTVRGGRGAGRTGTR
jgi:hypothetical protein